MEAKGEERSFPFSALFAPGASSTMAEFCEKLSKRSVMTNATAIHTWSHAPPSEMFSFVRVDRVDWLSVVFPHCREAVFKRLHVGTVSLALLSGNFVVQSAGMLRLFSDSVAISELVKALSVDSLASSIVPVISVWCWVCFGLIWQCGCIIEQVSYHSSLYTLYIIGHRRRRRSGWSGFGRTTFSTIYYRYFQKLRACFTRTYYSQTTSKVLPMPSPMPLMVVHVMSAVTWTAL